MLSKKYTEMLNEKDIIFEISGYGRARAEKIGTENVFDFSLGNPSVPAPASVNSTIKKILDEKEPLAVHGYGPGMGIAEVRQAVAESLNRRFGMEYSAKNIFMSIGAAGALAHAFRAVTNPGDEIITFAPCFSEYKPYTQGAGLVLKTVPADIEGFQINFEELEKMFNSNVTAVLINTPNNPSGVVYSTETIKRLAEVLNEKQNKYGHSIYLISDEPYREIVFKGIDAPFVSKYYDNTIMCYSFSKSISLPGERIGYLAVNPRAENAEKIIEICPQISRTIGQNGAATLMQLTVKECIDETSDLDVYETNKKLIYDELIKNGFKCVEPGGTFYMFPQCLEENAYAFCEKAKQLDLLFVPGDVFGCPGHFRIAYCVQEEKVRRALPLFKKLADMYK